MQRWTFWLGIYGQAENLTNNRHIAPIGYPSLPVTGRIGLKIVWGPGSKR
jgi:vitamin B12 transporter